MSRKKVIRVVNVNTGKDHYATEDSEGWRLLCRPDTVAAKETYEKSSPYHSNLCAHCAGRRPCKHREWKRIAHSSKYIEEYCTTCGVRRQRLLKDLSDTERAWLSDHWRSFMRECPKENVHRVWHAFQDYFIRRVPEGEPFEFCGKMMRHEREEWKWRGYELMCRINKWADKHPNDVFIHGCDDSHFMGSDMVYILHRSQTEWMGVTVLFVPQNGDEPKHAFYYPGHMLSARNMLDYLLKMCEAYKGAKWEVDFLREKKT